MSSNTSAKARSIPCPDSHRLTARTPGVSISQPSPGKPAAVRRSWCGDRDDRPRARLPVSITSSSSKRVDERRLADTGCAEERQRPVARGVARESPRARCGRRPLASSTGTPSATCGEVVARRFGIVDEVGLGQQRRPVARPSRTRAPARARAGAGSAACRARAPGRRRRCWRPSVSASKRSPSNDARRVNADVRSMTCSTRSPSLDGTTQSPMATSAYRFRTRSGDVSSADRITVLHPRSIRDTRPGTPGEPERDPCRLQGVVPSEPTIGIHAADATGHLSHAARCYRH